MLRPKLKQIDIGITSDIKMEIGVQVGSIIHLLLLAASALRW
jgi:hypothetical protein